MTATALAAPTVDVNWTEAVYTDANGNPQTVKVDTTMPDPGYSGNLGLPAVAANNDVTFNGTYNPQNGNATIKVTILDNGTKTAKDYTPMVSGGSWTVKIPKGDLKAATTYTVIVDGTINGLHKVKDYSMNVANN